MVLESFAMVLPLGFMVIGMVILFVVGINQITKTLLHRLPLSGVLHNDNSLNPASSNSPIKHPTSGSCNAS
jgi:hypothetical protein